jgi:hypothetical protein
VIKDNSMPGTFIVPEIYFDFSALILSSILIFLFGSAILLFYSKRPILSLFISLLKSTLFFVFFALFFNDNNFNFPDALRYIEETDYLFHNVTMSEMLYGSNKFQYAGLGHTFYYYYSFLVSKVLGLYYFVPVACNIIFTFISGYYLYKFSNFYGVGDVAAKNISFLYIVHWDILAWSSFVNLRDVLISGFIIIIIYFYAIFIEKHRYLDLLKLIFALFVLSYLRTHLVYIFFAVFFAHIIVIISFNCSSNYSSSYSSILKAKIPRFSRGINLTIILLIGLILIYYNNNLISNVYLHLAPFINMSIPYGMVRFLLSPVPFTHTFNGYGFLFFSSILHWATFPFLIYGVYLLHKVNKRMSFLMLLFVSTIVILLGIYDYAQGPRQRLMLIPIFAMYQYIGIREFLYYSLGYRKIR